MKELPDLKQLTEEAKDALIVELWEKLEKLLKKKAKKTSRNSSLPPAKGFKAEIKRTEEGNLGQRTGSIGREGGGRELSEAPDQIIKATIKSCKECGKDIDESIQKVMQRSPDRISNPNQIKTQSPIPKNKTRSQSQPSPNQSAIAYPQNPKPDRNFNPHQIKARSPIPKPKNYLIKSGITVKEEIFVIKRDMNLIRELLLRVEDSKVELWVSNLEIDGYTDEEIAYNGYLMIDGGLAEGRQTTEHDGE